MAAPTYFAYLRVSRDSQDVANQRLGVLEYANANGYSPVVLIEDTVSRTATWKTGVIGHLVMEKTAPGDFILTSEFTRLGGSPAQVFGILEIALKRNITIVITKTKTVMDGSLHAQIQAAVFSMASMIEIEFVRARTKEGLQRARLEGRMGGRRKGSTGKLKLDNRKDQVFELLQVKLSAAKMAKHFCVTEKTMRKFIDRHFPKNKV